MGHVFLFFQLSSYFWLLNIVGDILVDIMELYNLPLKVASFIEKVNFLTLYLF